ncbi:MULTISPECIES: N-acetyl-gamma-glutamyl-phosphate reductase [unclassified Moraxella]|uniref:N-acetyl-gamma-glutamyl-phosphate reductase n=1 Tax=unclassified Moraxella TaxID=2685852 RepID=UPI003AF587B2
MSNKIKVGIVGGTGYTGVELIRLLSQHPQAEIIMLTSRSEAGRRVDDMFPSLRGVSDLVFSDLDVNELAKCDVVFFATPHGVAMKHAKFLTDNNTKVIDLAADFRLQNLADFKQWYDLEHECPDLLAQSAYGIPEINRQNIADTMIVGNAGCYPTTAILGVKPLIELQNQYGEALIEPWIVIDAKSGVSGAGRQAKMNLLFSETSDNFSAYGVAGHRHLPEIEQGIEQLLNAKAVQTHDIRFVPHLVPMIRGMFTTIHLRLTQAGQAVDWQKIYEQAYQDEYFVDVLPKGQYPDTRSVRASNRLRIAVQTLANSPMMTILVVQDNLVKGASGQAVQNMNILFGLDETLGLTLVPVVP